MAFAPRNSHADCGAYDGATTPMASPFMSGGGLSRPETLAAVGWNGADGAGSIGVIVCSAGYAPSDSVIVVSRSALSKGHC
jgi:hypothetical protein